MPETGLTHPQCYAGISGLFLQPVTRQRFGAVAIDATPAGAEVIFSHSEAPLMSERGTRSRV